MNTQMTEIFPGVTLQIMKVPGQFVQMKSPESASLMGADRYKPQEAKQLMRTTRLFCFPLDAAFSIARGERNSHIPEFGLRIKDANKTRAQKVEMKASQNNIDETREVAQVDSHLFASAKTPEVVRPYLDIAPSASKKDKSPFTQLAHKVALKNKGQDSEAIALLEQDLLIGRGDSLTALDEKQENPFLSQTVQNLVKVKTQEEALKGPIKENVKMERKGEKEPSFANEFGNFMYKEYAKEMGVEKALSTVQLNLDKVDPETKVDLMQAEKAAKMLIKAGYPKKVVMEVIFKTLRKTLQNKGKDRNLMKAIELKKQKIKKRNAIVLIRDLPVAKARFSDAMHAFFTVFLATGKKAGEKVTGKKVVSEMSPVNAPHLTSSAIKDNTIDGSNLAFREDVGTVSEFGTVVEAVCYFLRKVMEYSPVRFGEAPAADQASSSEVSLVYKNTSKPAVTSTL